MVASTNEKEDERMKTDKCPVCGWEIKDDGKKVQVNDRVVVIVCCDDCAEKVKADPVKYTKGK
jgi:hypothetical protein